MEVRVSSLQLIDFRSFENEKIKFDDVTVVVGANNVGKSNILRALELLPAEAQLDLTRDLRRRSAKSSPELIYTLELPSLPPDPRLDFQVPEKIIVKKTATEWCVLKEDMSTFGEEFVQKEYFRNNQDHDIIASEISVPPGKIIAGSLLDDGQKQELNKLESDQIRELIAPEINDYIKGLLPNIKNVWNPIDTDFITEDNAIDQLLTNQNLPLTQLLNKAFQKNPAIGNFQEILQKGIASEIQTYCRDATDAVNAIFTSEWNFIPPIKLSIYPRDSYLKVFFDQGSAGHLEPAFSSDGIIWLISFFIRLGMSEIQNSIILLDQPGEKIYPGGQKDLVRILEKLGEHNQIIYSTHSPFMITKKRLGRNVRIVKKETDPSGNQIGFSKITNDLNQLDIRQSDLLTNALGFSWTDFVPVGELNVLMEGKLDAAVSHSVERQKANINGEAEIDFSKTVIRGLGGASYIDQEARKLKTDGKKVLGVFDADWQVSTPNLSNKEKIKLEEINSSWSDIEDLIPDEYLKQAFQVLRNKYGVAFKYTKNLNGPGRGRKLKNYLKYKAPQSKISYESLVNETELIIIDLIDQVSLGDDKLPDSFYLLNSKICERLKEI